jgi:hypothetical protein
MSDEIAKRLKNYGIELGADDAWTVDFCARKTEHFVKNFCATSEIPSELDEIMVDIISSEIAAFKKFEAEENDIMVNSISEGDATVSFSSQNIPDSKRLETLVNNILAEKRACLTAFRKIRW